MPEQTARVAIITARGGSKRIPGKNIRPFLGKPILAYSIQAAIDSGLFDEIMVSTDDELIASEAVKHGATVPFLRSKETSGDFATTSEALLDVLAAYDAAGKLFSYACCMYPTAPFVTGEKLNQAFDKLIGEKLDTVFPVMAFSYPIFRSLTMENGRLKMMWEQYRNSRSQDLPQAYHDAGQFYFFEVTSFLKNKTLMSENIGGIPVSELEGQDIDSLTDWKLAEMKYLLLARDE